ncbi:hypothetical protein CVU82_02760 [Candidatus Falkowbacteria bacterium HGW-Falkowbacteria-1]|uniref:Uncharacterized protein n=1 Tax=Candidatus Falkowbacteria bacterium HGW-Falkowbacteria-1 TaxID=2013768 RepID=A0A2N2E9R3_9BACT|nr:MAG: hypothetical protein CVU82_02760 [Candidatus Falkowbacteria bacterium HGW-Falkowbacteria-1]
MTDFVEIQNWGFNSLTISSLMTMVFTIFQAYGFTKQGQKIWRRRSAKSLSAPFFFLFFFYFIAFIFYGLSKNSLAMVFNGLLFIPCIPVVMGIIKFKGLSLLDFLSFIFAAAIVPIMIVTNQKDIFVFILLVISLTTLATQPLTMIREGSRGSVEIKFVVVFLLTGVFWFVYALSINNWPLQIFNFVAVILYCLILFLYRKYGD